MPYRSVEDLLPSVQAHLPPHAQDIYLGAFNSAWTQYAARGSGQRESTAHRVAWAAVKRKYKKSGDRWIPPERARGFGGGNTRRRSAHSA